MRFTLVQLQRFLALSAELHFTRTAERLNVSQSLLSEQIRALEAAVGTPLLRRSSRKVELTPAGLIFSEEANLLLQGLGDAVASAREVASGRKAILRIGYTDEFTHYLLPELVRHLKTQATSAEIRLSMATVPDLTKQITDGSIDLALLAPLPQENSNPSWEMQILPSTELAVGLSREHPLSRLETVTLAQIAGEPFVASAALDAGSELLVERLFAEQGLRRRIVQRAVDPHLLNSLAGSGLGVLIGTAEDFALYPTLRAVPIAPRITLSRGAISRSSNRSELLQLSRAFIERARAESTHLGTTPATDD